MVSRREALAAGGSAVIGGLAGCTGKTVFDQITGEDAPEVDASFTGVEGDIEDWSLNGQIEVKAGSEDALVRGYMDDRIQVAEEELPAGEEETYPVSVDGSRLGEHEIRAIVEAGGNRYRDNESFEVGISDLQDQESEDIDEDNNDLRFGNIEEGYLRQRPRSRNRLESYLSDFREDDILEDLEIRSSSVGYRLDVGRDGDIEEGAIILNRDYDTDDRHIGFSNRYSSDLAEFSNERPTEFTDFLEYVEEGNVE